MIAYAFLQSRRLKAAGRKKKSRGTAATTEHAGHSSGHSRPLRPACPYCERLIDKALEHKLPK
nr:Transposase-like protein [Methylocystis sp. SC2]